MKSYLPSLLRLIVMLLVFLTAGQTMSQNMTLVSISPQPDSYHVSRSSNIEITFDQTLDGATLIDANVIVRGSMTNRISGTISGSGTNTLIFSPDANFRLGETISVTITTGLFSETGQNLVRGHTYSFTVISSTSLSSPVTLAQRNIGTTITSPEDVKTMDFDDDGDLDIITGSDAFSETIALYENDGNQNFCRSVLANFRNVELHDVDGDGDLDAFGFTGAFDTEINWFENEGTFPFTERIISSKDPWTLTGGDLDSDGDIDLVAATLLPDLLLWFPNDGSGNFTSQITIPSSFDGGSSSFLKVVDINADGAMDILAFHENSRNVVWYENDGAQGFTERIIDTPTNRQRFDTGDIDGDGDIDIVISSTDNSTALIAWYENDGAENFTANTVPVTAVNPLEDVKLTDLDGDMDLDILSGSYWFENDGAENFTQHLMSDGLILGINPYVKSVSYADLDNDGDMDVISLGRHKLSWQENTSFMQVSSTSPANAAHAVSADATITVEFSEAIDGATLNTTNFSVRNRFGQKVNGSLSGAGSNTIIFDPDVDFMAGEKVQVSINGLLLGTSGHSLEKNYGFEFTVGQSNTGTPTFTSNSISLHTSDVFKMAVADLDSDGDLDVISCSFDELAWHENDGAGTFTSQPLPATGIPVNVITLDINEDGFMDMIVDFSGSDPTQLYLNDGTQNFTQSDINQFSTLVRDFDLDGFPDFVSPNGWSNNQDHCGIYETTGIQLAQTNRTSISLGDVDNDGDLDLFRAGSTGTILDTNYGFINFIVKDTMNTVWTNDQQLADLDGDGDLDFIVVERFVGLAWAENRLNEASNDIGPKQSIGSLNQDPKTVRIADFDGDGDPDLVAISRNDDKVVWYENRLDELSADFSIEITVGLTADGPVQVEVGDMDNDGDLDVIALSDNDDELIWFENLLTGVCTTPTIDSQPVSQSVDKGESVTFSVTASGQNLTYQWQKDGNDISNATNPEYTITTSDKQDEGIFRCSISNACGTLITDDVTLLVCDPVIITNQSAGMVNLCEGQNHTFSITDQGDAVITYEWSRDDVVIPGASDSFYELTNIGSSDAGTYKVTASNDCGVGSALFQLEIQQTPVITIQPINQTVTKGENVTFTIQATGQNLTYQWQKDGVDISGAVTNTLTLATVQLSDAGVYTCNVTNDCGTIESSPAVLIVNEEVTLNLESSLKLSIYPNPSYEQIHIDGLSQDGNWSITFTDLSGKQITQMSLSKNKASLDVSTLGRGLHWISIVKDQEVVFRGRIILK
ncbi:MAG: FG-GAP-like repeat-containing protein [Cyclobacteriaceae bacterium]